MHRIAFSIASLIGITIVSPAMAANENVITQSKALAGNVTPGDTPGFPITINTPGAYVLGSGLDVTPGQWGILVNANGVDIDMSGYTLSGNGNADYGVVSGNIDSRIHDGNITAFKASGMFLRGNAWSIENMKIQRNSGMGIDATGARFISVHNTLVTFNGSTGVATGSNGVFQDSTVSENFLIGISCREICHVESTVVDNNRFGVSFDSGMVIGNTITRNTFQGIFDNAGETDVGYSNNMLIGNNITGVSQVVAIPVHPNTCIGKPC